MNKPLPSAAPRKINHPNKGGSSRKKLFAFLVIAGGLYVLWPNKNRPSDISQASSPPQELAAKAGVDEFSESPAVLPAAPVPANPAIEKRVKTGLNEIDLVVDEKGIPQMQFLVNRKNVCFPGDLDAIKKVHGTTGKLLLTLETLEAVKEHQPAYASQLIDIDDIEKGRLISFKYDMQKKGVFGIFLCSDAAQAKTCAGKEAADFNRILNQKNPLATDAIYYFQFGLFDSSFPTVFTGLPRGVADVREIIGEDYSTELEESARLMRAIRSFPPTTNRVGEVITVELPIAGLDTTGRCQAQKSFR